MVWAGDPQRQALRGIQPFHEGASGQQAAGVSPGWHVSPHSVSQNREAPGPDAPTRSPQLAQTVGASTQAPKGKAPAALTLPFS